MPQATVTLSLDEALIARAKGEQADLSAVVAAALRQYLDRNAETSVTDRRWAEDKRAHDRGAGRRRGGSAASDLMSARADQPEQGPQGQGARGRRSSGGAEPRQVRPQ